MERIMGRAVNPVRNVLNYAADRFLGHLPIVYVSTVVGRRTDGGRAVRGLFVGDDLELLRAGLSAERQGELRGAGRGNSQGSCLLDPAEFHSTWLGNKAIYRTRMALADDAELIILAPGVKEFGEDRAIDGLIRKYGYRRTPATLETVENADPAGDLSAAAHLIHGSSEGRFRITWCPGHLTREEVEGVGFSDSNLEKMLARYDPVKLTHGSNMVNGEEVFFIAHPGSGLWAHRARIAGD
jgi:hypothetical protein